MPTLSPAQIYTLARQAGLSANSAVVATAVALAESGGRTDAVGDVQLENGTWGPSVGLWQIRSLKAQNGTGGTRDASRLADPAFNAKSMAEISKGGIYFKPWTTFTNGSYKSQYPKILSDPTVQKDENSVAGQASNAGQYLGPVLGAGANAVSSVAGMSSSWGADALRIGLYVLGAATAAGLFIVGAVHTVSEK